VSRSALRCLFLNAGGSYHPHKDLAEDWVVRLVSTSHAPDVAFVQEVPSDAWLQRWRDGGYREVLGHKRGWKVRSAVLLRLPRRAWEPLEVGDIAELEYHGEYVAAARLRGWGTAGSDLTLLSLHAQPERTTKAYLECYPDAGNVVRRDGGADPRYRGELFDADVVLETVARQAPNVLACGDLSEARGWDDVPAHAGQTWGREFFGGVVNGEVVEGRVRTKGLVDVALSATGEEVVTRRAPGHPSLQLDHILTSASMTRRIHSVDVDQAWRSGEPSASGLADHAPVRFVLDAEG
jgi:hypothetical protein